MDAYNDGGYGPSNEGDLLMHPVNLAIIYYRKPAWRAHIAATRPISEVSHADLTWAGAYRFGSPGHTDEVGPGQAATCIA